VPSLDLRFADNKSLTDAVTGASLVTFTRASSGTFVDSAGVIQTAATDVPRFDHNPTTGESLGLLVEEQRTNLLLRSEEFGTTWATFRASVSSDATAAPDGNTTADKIVEDTTPINSHGVQQLSLSFTSGLSYTFSVYVKAAERANIRLGLPATAFTTALSAQFNLLLGTTTALSAGVTATVSALPNGWYRCAMTAVATATATGGVPLIMGELSTSTTTAYTGDGTSGLFLWGAQLEAGAFPTSYIKNVDTAAGVTRSADLASITGSAFSSWYRQDEGTVFAEGRRDGTADGRFVGIDTGSISNTYVLTASAARNANVTSVSGGAFGGGPSTSNSFIYQAPIRVAASLSNSQDETICLNGGAVATGNATAPVGPLTTMNIGTQSGASTSFFNGHIKRICFWPQRLANSTLQQITQ
jgi:hypothetical protein